MKNISFDYENSCLISTEILQKTYTTLLPEINRISKTQSAHYSTEYASINLPFDTQLIETITTITQEKKTFSPTLLIVIGIGGSNLGTIAVLQAIRGKFYNNHHAIKTYFIDTVDTDTIADVIKIVEHNLMTNNNIIINVISKSGSTIETIANFTIFLEILKKYRSYDYHNFVIVTTDQNSALWQLAQEKKFTTLIIPEKVGGRYSVLSAVGLFPLNFLDIDIKELTHGAQDGYIKSIAVPMNENYAALSASIIFNHYQQKIIIHDSFIFAPALESFGAWYRQLSAESLGKAYNKNNEHVAIGLLPTISIGSTDLHSVAQLYLAGPHNRFTTFITIDTNNSTINIPNNTLSKNLAPSIQNRSFSEIMHAIAHGTQQTYRNKKLPFLNIMLPEKSTYYIGQLMQIKMIEIIYLGFLLNVNPFDQPEVELYKKETKKSLLAIIT